MSEPPVSVLTTVYNRAQYLPECIESVLASSFRDFEYIIVDDCSTDASYEIALEYARKDSRIRVYRNEKNLGDYPNRNKAATYATGNYLKYVDSDDVIYPHGLTVMVEAMERSPEAALGLCRPPLKDKPYPVCLDPMEAYEKHFLGDGLFSNSPLSAIIYRRRFVEAGGFSGRRYIGDTELWLKLARMFPVVLMPMGLTWWRTHGDQELFLEVGARTGIAERFRLDREAIKEQDCPLSKEKRSAALKSVMIGHIQQLLLLFRHGRCREAWRLFRAARLNPALIWPALHRLARGK